MAVRDRDGAIETASWARRVGALLVDWFASTLVVIGLVGLDRYSDPAGPEQFFVLGAYVVESALLTWLLGGSFGKLVTGLRVVPSDGRARLMNPLLMLLRQVLVALVIPPLVYRPDGRGLHDMMSGTATVTTAWLRTQQAR